MKRKQLLPTLVTIVILAVAATAMAQRNSKAQASPDDSNLMDLNSAPPEKLMTLPGVDLMMAKKIIAARPYKTKNDLLTKKVIAKEAFDGITNRVTVKPITTKAPPSKSEG